MPYKVNIFDIKGNLVKSIVGFNYNGQCSKFKEAKDKYLAKGYCIELRLK